MMNEAGRCRVANPRPTEFDVNYRAPGALWNMVGIWDILWNKSGPVLRMGVRDEVGPVRDRCRRGYVWRMGREIG